jgi:LAO/AO transport system kinase
LAALSREPALGIMRSLGSQVSTGDLTPEAAATQMLGLLGKF